MGRTYTPEQLATKAATNKRWREKNAERLKKYEAGRKNKPERVAAKKHWMRKHRYGITSQEYAALVKRAGGRCELCGRKFKGGKKSIHVDHDHETGRVRGLLCPGCNTALGQLCDLPGVERALAYLLGAEQSAFQLAIRASGMAQLCPRPDRTVAQIRHHAAGCECLPCRFAQLRDAGRVEGDREQLRAADKADLLRDDSLGDLSRLDAEPCRHRMG
ncbi:MAG: endonuclease VII domain-containing protein [Acidiferrobacteraceae bacterium]